MPGVEKDAWEQAAQDVYPGFRFTERTSNSRMVPVRNRDEYFPVYYAEPQRGNEEALGFDLASEPTRRQALFRARDTGEMVGTGRVTLVQERRRQFGVLIFLPVYKTSTVPPTVAARRRDLTGFVLGVFRIEDIVDRALEGFASRRLQLVLKDGLADGSAELLYTKVCWKGVGGIQADTAYSEDRVQQTIAVATRQWQATWIPIEGAKAGGREWIAIIAVVVGLITTGTVAAYLHVLLGRKEAVEALVGERTNDLTETNEALEQASQQLLETNLQLEALAQVDALTGIANRRSFDETLEKELGRARREVQPLSLLLCDVDFFKIYNDTFGHVAGDMCLQKIARTIETRFHRSSDHVSRYGGEEFAAILPATDTDSALAMAQQLCVAVFDLGIRQSSPRIFAIAKHKATRQE